MISPAPELLEREWTDLARQRGWLFQQAEALFSFFERRIINPLGGFYDLDDGGRHQRCPVTAQPASGSAISRNLENHSRLCNNVPHRSAGRGHHYRLRDEFLVWNSHRDSEYAGYYWGAGSDGPSDSGLRSRNLTELLVGAFEATNASTYLRIAERIADLIMAVMRRRKRLPAS